MNQALAQSAAVLILGVGLWLFLLQFVYTGIGFLGVSLLAFGVIVILSRALPTPTE